MNPDKITEVVAALIERNGATGERQFLISKRPPHKKRGMLWEFVGGKVEPGETKEQALTRELREEMDVAISVGEVYMEVLHEYPDLTVRLTLFRCGITEGKPKLLEHCDLRWISRKQIPEFLFCPADEEILKKLMNE